MKEMGAVKDRERSWGVGGEDTASDCMVGGITYNKGTVLMYSQWTVL